MPDRDTENRSNEQSSPQTQTRTEELYKGLVDEGLYTRDFDTFQSQYSDREARQNMYEGLNERGLVTVDYSEFESSYFPQFQDAKDVADTDVADNVIEENMQKTPQQMSSEIDDDGTVDMPESFQNVDTEGVVAGPGGAVSTGIDTGQATPIPRSIPETDDGDIDLFQVRDEIDKIDSKLKEVQPQRTVSSPARGVGAAARPEAEEISEGRRAQIGSLRERRKFLDQQIAAAYMPLYQEKLKLQRRKSEIQSKEKSRPATRPGTMGGGFRREGGERVTDEELDELNEINESIDQIDGRIDDIKPEGFAARYENALNSVARSAMEAPLIGAKGLAAWVNGDEAADSALYRMAENANIAIDEALPTDPTLQEEFLSSILPSAFGSMASYVGIGALMSPLGTAATAAGVGAFAGLAGSGQAYEAVKDAGGSDEDATIASRWGFAPGVLQVLPVMRVLNRYDKASGGTLRQNIARQMQTTRSQRVRENVGGSLVTGVDEAIVESLGQGMQNKIFNEVLEELINDPDYDIERKDISEGTIASALGGLGAGTSIDALTQFIAGRYRGPRVTQTARQKDYNDQLTEINQKLYGDLGQADATDTQAEDTRYQEQELSPDIRFEWDPSAPPEQQTEQLSNERERFEQMREEAVQEGDDSLVEDIDQMIENIDGEIVGLQESVDSEQLATPETGGQEVEGTTTGEASDVTEQETKVGDKVILFDPAGNEVQAEVLAISEQGTLRVRNEKGEEVIVDKEELSEQSPKDPAYEIPLLGKSVSEASDAELSAAESRLDEIIEARQDAGQPLLTFVREKNAIRLERNRRDEQDTDVTTDEATDVTEQETTQESPDVDAEEAAPQEAPQDTPQDDPFNIIDEQFSELESAQQDVSRLESRQKQHRKENNLPDDAETPFDSQLQQARDQQSELSGAAENLPSLTEQVRETGNERLTQWVEENPTYDKYSVNVSGDRFAIINRETGREIDRRSSAYDKIAGRIIPEKFADGRRLDESEGMEGFSSFERYLQEVGERSENPMEVLEAIDSFEHSGLAGETLHTETTIRQEFFTPKTQLRTEDVRQFFDYGQVQDDTYLKNRFSQDGKSAESISLALDREYDIDMSPEQVIEEFITYLEDVRGLSKKPFDNRHQNQLADRFEDLTGIPYSENISNLALEEFQEQRLDVDRQQAEYLRDNFMDDEGNVSVEEMMEMTGRDLPPDAIALLFQGATEQQITQAIQDEQTQEEAQTQGTTAQRPQEDSGLEGQDSEADRAEPGEGESRQRQSQARSTVEATQADGTGDPPTGAQDTGGTLESGERAKSDNILRRLQDLRNNPEVNADLESIGDYDVQSVEAANRESDSLIADLQQDLGNEQGLLEAFSLLQDNQIPDMMVGPVAEKVGSKMQRLGMNQEAVEVYDWLQERARESARVMRSLRSDASPESTVSRAFAGLERAKSEALEGDFKDGKTYNEVLEEIQATLKDLIGQENKTEAEIRGEMIESINNLLKPEGREGKKNADARKKASENIADMFLEEGTADNISDQLAELAGFDSITQSEKNAILDKVMEVSDLISDGKKELAATRYDELMNDLIDMNLIDRGGAEIIQDLWYSAVLSGLTTIERSHLGSLMTSTIHTGTTILSNPRIMPLAISQMIKGFQGSLGTYKHVVKTGQTDVQFADFKPEAPKYTNKIARARYEELDAKDQVMKAFMALPIRAYRTILAFDQVLKHTQSEGYQAIMHYDNALDNNKTHTDAVKEAKEKLQTDSDNAAKEQAREEIEQMKEEGEKVPDGYFNRRWREIQNQKRDQDIVKKALEESALAAMVSHPRGALGALYSGWDNAITVKPEDGFMVQAGKLGARGVFPFLRVAINYTNLGLDFTPVGLARGTISKDIWTKDGKRARTRSEKRASLLRSAIGVSTYLGILGSMFEWDDDEENFKLRDEEDRWIEVVGPGTGNWWEEDDIGRDFKPWSVRFKNPVTGDWSKYRSFIDNPIGFALAPIGIMSDEIRFRNFRRDARGQDYADEMRGMGYMIGTGMRGVIQYTFDQSFNQGLNSIGRIASSQTNETMNSAVQDAFVRPAEGFYPGIYHQMYSQYRALMDIPEKQANTWYERPLTKVPFADGLIKNHRFDAFGYPIIRDFDVPFIHEAVLKQATDNVNYRDGIPEWELLWKHPEVTIGNFLPPLSHEGERLTDEQRNNYQEEAGLRMRDEVSRRMNRLQRMDKEDLQKELFRLRRRSASRARSAILEGRGRKMIDHKDEQ